MPKRLSETYHKIGELLVRRRLVPPEAIDEALAEQRTALERRKYAPRLGEILIERKVLDRRCIKQILDEQKLGRGEKRTLKIGLKDHDDVAVMSLEGRFDDSKEKSVTNVLERLMNAGYSKIALDCSKLVFLSSHGLSCLVSYVDEARARGGDLKLFGVGPDAKFVIERLGLTAFIQILEDQERALKAFELNIDEYMSRGALSEYVSQENGRYFHLSFCACARKIPESDRTYYESKWHARSDGKLPCRICKP